MHLTIRLLLAMVVIYLTKFNQEGDPCASQFTIKYLEESNICLEHTLRNVDKLTLIKCFYIQHSHCQGNIISITVYGESTG